jgi:hypothetical protein
MRTDARCARDRFVFFQETLLLFFAVVLPLSPVHPLSVRS